MRTVLLLVVILSCVLQPVESADLVKKAVVDLNADGTRETVSIDIEVHKGEFALSTGDYTLHVNSIAVKGRLREGVDGFFIADIDPSDKFKEIAVHTSGPSDDFGIHLYWYDGKNVKDMGEIDGSASFPANATVLSDTWQGFWLMRNKYALDKKTRELKKVPQDLYWVNTTGHVGKGFPIYTSRQDSIVLANLKQGSEILVVACDPSPTKCRECKLPEGETENFCDWECDWYLVRSTTGLLGWVRLKTLSECVHDLPWAG